MGSRRTDLQDSMSNMLHRALNGLSKKGRSIDRLLGPEGFLEMSADEVARALRYDRPLSVAMIAVDGLSLIRKGDGKHVARQVMLEVTKEVISAMRRMDRVGRLSARDLGILMPETTLNNAAGVMERLRRTVELLEVPTEAGTRSVSLSIGVVAVSPRLRDPRTFLMRACLELRRANNEGRNRVCVAAPDRVRLSVPRSGQIH